jgi:hypothetical protein
MLDGLYYAIMVGLAEAYIAPFALRLGLGPIAAGLIVTVPALVGAAAQLRAPRYILRVGSYSRFMKIGAALQGLMYLPLAMIAVAGPWLAAFAREHAHIHALSAIVFLVWIAYWVFGAACGPAWQTAAGAIIPSKVRAGYFAKRSRILHFATLLSLLLQGVLMTQLTKLAGGAEPANAATDAITFDPVLLIFAGLFVAACAFRLLSAYYLGRYSEPEIPPHRESRVSPLDAARRLGRAPDGRYLLYMLCTLATVQISGPYFNPYMVEILRADQTPMFAHAPWLGPALSWLLAGAILGRIIALPTVGALSRRFGAHRVLRAAGILLIPSPLFWLVSDNTLWLLGAQITIGIIWAGFELSTFLLNYVMLKPEERTSILTLYAAANEVGKSAGSMVGAALLGAAGEGRLAYVLVFWVSSAARLLSLPLLSRVREPEWTIRKTTQVIDPGPPSGPSGEGSTHEPLLADSTGDVGKLERRVRTPTQPSLPESKP